jgi:serine/threonine-protein kinase
VARELCEGLHAIHEQGVLHRDLKPANVLIDGRGRVRIADFGLAAVAGAVQREAIASGTPAYMAPEQFAEREVTVRSDVYALGVVLHELFTGRRPGESEPAPGRTVTSRTAPGADPLARLDPAIERAIRRCLQPEPAVRPASALQVAGSLPGGDPIAYALAAGETPSPEMVAAAGGTGGVRAPVAAAIVVLALALLASVLMLADRRDAAFWAGAKPFAALRDRASEFAHALGADANDADREDGIARFPRAGDPASVDVNYWRRTSPHALPIAVDIRGPGSILAFALPAIETPGESGQRRKLDGRLVEYRRIPHQTRALSRKNILMRDRYTCQYCHKTLPSTELTLDHVVPFHFAM